jgi:hypothetical protein
MDGRRHRFIMMRNPTTQTVHLGHPLGEQSAARLALFIKHDLAVLMLVVGVALAVKISNNRRETEQ